MLSANVRESSFSPFALGQAGERAEGVRAAEITVTHCIEEVEAEWRQLSRSGVESPGQSYDFIRLWVADRSIAPEDQLYVLGRVAGEPVALLPLHRRRVWGCSVFTWFAGAHANCHAPIADPARLAALGSEGRAALWHDMLEPLKTGADAVYLRSIPAEIDGYGDLFDELGEHLAIETLYRSRYDSWDDCDGLQRSRSRRKHDRQQGERLAALGAVRFEQLRVGDDLETVIDTMFRQRSARFRAMGIRDLFVLDGLTGFYRAAASPGSGLDVRLHVLRLDEKIVAVRYNVVLGRRMFCLISSMSDDLAIQSGSPGKQCLLR
ncbi:GNAT family N-acetyltransferase, partial [Devosia sp.]|uniref:GNAT family N-acetyltransferase n=1 Tax=Devosia sp. TaxID=1871048 RepID=UPI002AFF4928